MQIYSSYRYIFPPRPEIKTTKSGIKTYERMGWFGQPKLNGSCSLIFTDGINIKLMNRHEQAFARELVPKEDLARLHKGGGFQILCGEFMNKSKKDANGRTFNGCIVLFDILVHKGQYLLGTSLKERQELMDNLFPVNSYDAYIDNVSNNIFRVKNFTTNLEEVWNEIIKIDMYEGVVLKNPLAILDTGYRPSNNTGWQIKVRKPTRNYSY